MVVQYLFVHIYITKFMPKMYDISVRNFKFYAHMQQCTMHMHINDLDSIILLVLSGSYIFYFDICQ